MPDTSGINAPDETRKVETSPFISQPPLSSPARSPAAKIAPQKHPRYEKCGLAPRTPGFVAFHDGAVHFHRCCRGDSGAVTICCPNGLAMVKTKMSEANTAARTDQDYFPGDCAPGLIVICEFFTSPPTAIPPVAVTDWLVVPCFFGGSMRFNNLS